MVALTVESARAARAEAERLRAVMFDLRLAMRAKNRAARARQETAAAEAARAQVKLARSTPSPWSELAWRLDYAELERALVPLD